MKISREERAKVRRNILEAAGALWSEQGYFRTTMKDIARASEIADATIYKHFATKEKILYGLFHSRLEQSIELLSKIHGFEQFTFQEQLHAFVEAQFESYEDIRGLLARMGPGVALMALGPYFTDFSEIKNLFIEVVAEMLDEAVEAGEFPKPPFGPFVLELLWEFDLGVMQYWVHDESKDHARTTQFLDRSLDLINEALRAAVLTKGAELAKFLIRNHFLSNLSARPKEAPAKRKILAEGRKKRASPRHKNG